MPTSRNVFWLLWRLLWVLALLAVDLGQHSALAADADLENRLQQAFDRGDLRGLHSVYVWRRGQVLAELHFPGPDQRWGTPLADPEHSPDSFHDLRSVTKSIVGLLYGIALAEKLVPEVDARLLDQFPEYADLAADPARREILIRHALSMRMGTQWNEDLPYTNPQNSEIAMERAEDRYRYVLDRPMAAAPGQRWTYNGGATAIVARLIAKGAGMPIDRYAKEKLFDPLGIDGFEWVRGADGTPSAASGLRLTARDLARIGRMILDRGAYNGRQVVPASWLERSFTPRAEASGELRYPAFLTV